MLELLIREFRAFKTEVLDRIARLEAGAATASADAPQPAADPKAKDSAKSGS